MLRTFKIIPLLALLMILPLVQGIEPIQIDQGVFQVFADGDSLWFTTKDQGSFTVSPSHGTKEHLVAPTELPTNKITCGVQALGRVWLGSEDGLFYSEAGQLSWSEVDTENLPSTRINCLEGNEESLWVGTPGGAAELENGTWREYGKSDGLSDTMIMDIELHGEDVWFGTIRGGVNRYGQTDGTWQSWNTDKGLISNTVFSVSCSDTHAFIATASGFSVLNLDSSEITNYGSDKLPSSSVTCSAWCGELGQAWIGTGKGIAIWSQGQENLTVIEDVGKIELGKIHDLEVLNGAIWATRSNTEWYYHQTTGALCFDLSQSKWIRPTFLDVLIDQAGYSPGHPKSFMVQSNKPLEDTGSFRVVSGAGNQVYTGVLGQRVDREDWDAYYWKGNFTRLERRGNFSIQVSIGEAHGESYRFEIDNDVLLDECGELIYDFLTYMKCGVTIPGYRTKACHLDDAVLPNGTHIDATGGWHCAGLWGGKYSRYHTYVLFNLLFARDMRPSFYQEIDRDGDGMSDILNHAMWGCDYLTKMQLNNGSIYHEVRKIEITDGIIGTKDDRPIREWAITRDGLLAVAGWAGTSALVEERYPQKALKYLQAAERSFSLYGRRVSTGPRNSVETAAMLLACIQMHRATGNVTYLELAEDYCNITLTMDYSRYYGPFVPCVLGYYLEMNPSTQYSQGIMDYIVNHAEKRISRDLAPDDDLRPFGVPTFRTARMSPEAAPALFAYKYTGNSPYLEYALGVLGCHLGINPYGICMLEGTGTRNPPGYANDYALAHSNVNPYTKANPDNPGGAHPGAIPQGIKFIDGKPWYETSTNPGCGTGETWLINTNFLQPVVLIPRDDGNYPLEVGEMGSFMVALLVMGSLVGFLSRTN